MAVAGIAPETTNAPFPDDGAKNAYPAISANNVGLFILVKKLCMFWVSDVMAEGRTITVAGLSGIFTSFRGLTLLERQS